MSTKWDWEHEIIARLWFSKANGLKLSVDEIIGAAGCDAISQRLQRTVAEDAIVKAFRNEIAALPAGAQLVHRGQDAYPKQLSDWDRRPWFLYIAGQISEARHIAMVGSREADSEGLRIGARLAAELAPHVEVVSGGARGMDAAAHRGALTAGTTTVVLPSGLDRPSPVRNRPLFNRVLESGGTIISEMPLGSTVRKHHFARRNALLVALSEAVIVVRAESTGGTMLTAKIAKQQGRPLFAVPGSPDDPCSLGVLTLARDGAPLVWQASHILPEISALDTSSAAPIRPRLSPPAAQLLRYLREEKLTRFAIADLPTENVFAALMELEIEALVQGTDQHGIWGLSARGKAVSIDT